jgi:5-methylthioribose kinase
MEYYSLDEKTAIEYVKKVGLFPQDSSLEVQEIGDGNINMVFKVIQKDIGKTMIIKQALPYVRCVGPSWPLTLDRMRIEAEAMEIQNKYAPGLVPKIYNHDSKLAVIIMEDLSHLGVMRGGTLKMQKYPRFAEHISTFMANLLFYTSDLAMTPEDKKRLVGQFINPELCRIAEDLIFTDPYYDCKRNIINPALRDYLEKVFWKKNAFRLEASKFKYKFITEAQSLLHGDLHTGSIFASEQETRVFDTEFSFVGPSAFDVGLLTGNILINYFSWNGKDEPAEKKKDYQQYLLAMINEIYELFEKKFLANWQKDSLDVIATVPGYQEYYMRKMFVDMIGYAAVVMVRRMHGLAHNIDVDGIKDQQRRRDVQITILEAAEELMMNRKKFMNISELTKFISKNAD